MDLGQFPRPGSVHHGPRPRPNIIQRGLGVGSSPMQHTVHHGTGIVSSSMQHTALVGGCVPVQAIQSVTIQATCSVSGRYPGYNRYMSEKLNITRMRWHHEGRQAFVYTGVLLYRTTDARNIRTQLQLVMDTLLMLLGFKCPRLVSSLPTDDRMVLWLFLTFLAPSESF